MSGCEQHTPAFGYEPGVSRIGWHLDDVPQPYLTYRRVAFAVLLLGCIGAGVCGVLFAYDGTHHKSMILPFALLGGVIIASVCGGRCVRMDEQEGATVAGVA